MIHRRNKNWDRAAILWGLVGFVALQIGTALWIELGSGRLRDPEYAALHTGYKRRAAKEPARALRVVMLGSSRTQNGLCAELVETQLERTLGEPVCVFNFGIPGGGPIREWAMLRRLLATGPRPNVVLLEIAPVLIRDTGTLPADEQTLSLARLSYEELGELEHVGLPVESHRQAVGAGRLVPWSFQRVNLVLEFTPSWLPRGHRWVKVSAKQQGWSPLWPEQITAAERSKACQVTEAEQTAYLRGLRVGEPAERLMREMLVMCRGHGVQAALVFMPEGARYRSWYEPGTWPAVSAWARGLSEEFDVPLINARKWVPEEGFIDSQHLEAPAAQAFSERLAQEAILPWIADVRGRGRHATAVARGRY